MMTSAATPSSSPRGIRLRNACTAISAAWQSNPRTGDCQRVAGRPCHAAGRAGHGLCRRRAERIGRSTLDNEQGRTGHSRRSCRDVGCSVSIRRGHTLAADRGHTLVRRGPAHCVGEVFAGTVTEASGGGEPLRGCWRYRRIRGRDGDGLQYGRRFGATPAPDKENQGEKKRRAKYKMFSERHPTTS